MSGTFDPMAMPGLGMEQQAGFGGGANDPYLMMLMRRRAMAEALQNQQGQQGPMTHPLQVLGSIAQQGVGAWQQGKAEQQYLDYSRSQQEAQRKLMQEALGDMGPTPQATPMATPAPAAQAPTPASAQSGASAFMSPGIEAMVKDTATRHGVPPALARALVMQESGGNPAAVGRAGEAGLSQILPSTARNPGFGMQGVDPATLRDPAANLDFGMQYLAARAKSAGLDLNNPEHVAQALKLYNGGGDPNYVANVSRHMGGSVPPQPGPTGPSQVSSGPSAQAPDQRAAMVDRARRLMATGSPQAQRAAMQILALAKAMPDPPNWTTTNVNGQVMAINPRDPSQMRPLGVSNDRLAKTPEQIAAERAVAAPHPAVAATPEREAQELRLRPPTTLSPGQVAVGPGGQPIASVPARPQFHNVPPGNMVLSADGQPVTTNPDKGQEFGRSNTLRDEFTKLTTDFRTLGDAHRKIRSAAAANTGAGDMAMLYSFVKMLDPGSVVRESEFATAAASGSLGERMQGAVQRILTGERMAPQLRAEFLAEAEGIMKAQRRGYDQMQKVYRSIASRAGLNPEDIVIDQVVPEGAGVAGHGAPAQGQSRQIDPNNPLGLRLSP